MMCGRIASILTIVVAAVGAVQAAVVPVPNGSFESPVVPLQDIAAPGADDWTTTGGNNTGIFPNLPMDENFGGVIAKRITNADGSQLAFIAAIYDPNGTTDNGTPIVNEFYQQLPADYQPGQSYVLSVGVTTSSAQPPDAGAKLRLELYYPGNGGQQSVASTLVTSDEASVENQLLKYYTVQTPVVAAGAPYANQPIGILLSTTDNSPTTGGTFDMDNVTLTSVPEPAAGAVMALGAALVGIRRRTC